jgi:hypothetical protein
MAVSSSPDGSQGPCLAQAFLNMVELAGRLAQQHAEELKKVLRVPGDGANQARTQLQALAQALHDILSTSSGEGEERESGGTVPMEEGGEERASQEVS